MANQRSRVLSRSSPSLRRKTGWVLGPKSGVGGVTQTISATGKAGFITTTVFLQDGLTIVRTRGEARKLQKNP